MSSQRDIDQVESQNECNTPTNLHFLTSTSSQNLNCENFFEPQESQPIEPQTDSICDGRKRKLTSSVWDHMKKMKKDDVEYAICNYCKKALKASSKTGTSSLRSHLNICPRKMQENIGEAIDRQKQKQIQYQKQSDGKFQYKNFNFDLEFSRHQLARAIILHEYPLSIVDHIGFRDFVYSLQPHFKMVSRNTIKREIIKIYEEERLKLQSLLEKNTSRVAITTDMWSSNQKKGYMSITAHFVDNNWALQSRILRFIYVPAPHTTEVLAENLLDGLTTWNLETKLSTITVDNCSTNDAVVKVIVDKLFSDCLLGGRFVHMRCCAHILNLIVKDGLIVIDDAIETIRQSVLFWYASPSRWEKFEDMGRQMKLACTKKLGIDVKTRWNSTYLMLHVALEYKDVFPRMRLRDKNYKNVPSELDWSLAAKICEKLKFFHSVTELFSGRKYPTSNTYFVKVCELRENLSKWISFEDEIIASMAKKMFDKFEKYWSYVHIVMAVSVVLDPRYKIKVVEFYFPSFYGEYASVEIERVKKCCYDLLQEYQSKSVCKSHENIHGPCYLQNLADSAISNVEGETMAKLVQFLSSSATITHVKSELDHYLEESVLPWSQDFDILNWWKTNGIKYHTLQLIARDLLAIPISTVASESAFSTSGRVVNPHRSRLHPHTLEVLMCSQSWLWGNMEGVFIPPDFVKVCAEEEDVD